MVPEKSERTEEILSVNMMIILLLIHCGYSADHASCTRYETRHDPVR